MDFMAFLKSLTPWHLKCIHCQKKLRLKKYEFHAFLSALVVGIIALSGLSYYNASSLTYALILTAVVAGFEYLFFIIIRKLGVVLELR